MSDQASQQIMPSMSRNQRRGLFVLIAGAVTIAVSLMVYFGVNLLPKGYEEAYRLVPEKISRSAMIAVRLPKGVDASYAKSNIKFDPEISGVWQKNNNPLLGLFVNVVSAKSDYEVVYYRPNEDLKTNRYYRAVLMMTNGEQISADFEAVDDPAIIAIFPKDGSEAPEDTEITIVFNRPMVPLTTLQNLESKNIPVEITPQTPGRFKWITTRNLQFIPQDKLQSASTYTVKVKPGFISMDGIRVKETSVVFYTRRLRYQSFSEGAVPYNQPFIVRFNQPVDLNRLKDEIAVTDINSNSKVPVSISYHKATRKFLPTTPQTLTTPGIVDSIAVFFSNLTSFSIFPKQNKVTETASGDDVNKSVVEIYNQADQFGLAGLWNFNHSYTLSINKAYPLEGDLILDQSQSVTFGVPDFIESVGSESVRAAYSRPEYFDPQGSLIIRFYEEVDLGRSQINGDKIKDITYGEKCREDEYYSYNDCPKITDKKIVKISFNAQLIGLGEKLTVVLDKIVNPNGLTINSDSVTKELIAFPKFTILKTYPNNGAGSASVTDFTICSNNPIIVPEKADSKKHIIGDGEYEVNYWGTSYRIDYIQDNRCDIGQFMTNISYGLAPNSRYSFTLKLEDVFGQGAEENLQFTTGEMPAKNLTFFHFQASYNVTTSSKTKLTYAVQNMEYVNMEICQLDAVSFLKNLNKQSWDGQISSVSLPCESIVKEKISLGQRYWGKNYFQVNIADYFTDPLGYYILTFSNPNYRRSYWDSKINKPVERQAFERTYLNVTDLSVMEKRTMPGSYGGGNYLALSKDEKSSLSNLYWVTEIKTLEPVGGALVTLYKGESDFISQGTLATDSNGIAKTENIDYAGAVTVNKGNDSTAVPLWENKMNWAENAYSSRRMYLYTDKPIYRPGQDVFVKGIYRLGYDGNYEIYRDKSVNLKVNNSRYDQILSVDLDVSEFGTVNTKVNIDNNAPLGLYSICAESYDCAYFNVLEYEPAAFKVELKTDKEEYVSKDTVNMEIKADYYFGVPVETGEAEYTISSQNYYFDRYKDGYYHFGVNDICWVGNCYGEKFISRGEATLANGIARLSVPADLSLLFKNEDDRSSKIIVFDITVKTNDGRSVSQQKSFILHGGDYYIGIIPEKWFVGKGEEAGLKIKTVDTTGKPVAVNSQNLSVYRVRWDYLKRQEATGGYSYKWEKKRDLINHYPYSTDGSGNYRKSLIFDKEGEYEIEAFGFDNRGNKIRSVYTMYVYGEGSVSIRPTNNTDLEIVPEKSNLNVGEKGAIVIKSPFNKAKAFIALERGKVFDYQIIDVIGNLYKFDFDVKGEYAPNIYLSALLLSPSGEVKFGQAEFKIDTPTKELNITAKTNKTHYLPGEQVNLSFAVKDNEGRPVMAELSAAVVDLSVLALEGNQKKDPVIFFYGGFPLTVTTSVNTKNILIQTDIPTKGGGGGEASSQDKALAVRVRGEFKETALWLADITTGSDGKAVAQFVLPDNLTTWQMETLGVTKDTKLGVNYLEFKTRKELMVVPLKPRFIVPGDNFTIGATVFNQSGQSGQFKVSLKSGTLNFKDSTEKTIRLAASSSTTVYFKVEAPINSPTDGTMSHQFTLSAKGIGLEDTVIQLIRVTANDTFETVSTANYTREPITKEYIYLPNNIVKEKGSLKISGSATLAVFVYDGLKYLLEYPYGCAEQISSRLNAIAILKSGLNIPNLGDKIKLEKINYNGKEYTIDEVAVKGLADLYKYQRPDGGFALWGGTDSSFYATLSVVEAMNNLSVAGYSVDKTAIQKGADYLYKAITTRQDLYSDNNNLILTAYILSPLKISDKSGLLKEKIIKLTENDLYIREQISTSSLAYLSLLMDERYPIQLRSKIYESLDNRVNIDSRGAFVEPNDNFGWYYYETATKDTALYLKSLAVRKNESPITDKVLRWLLNSRDKNGVWGSTNNTLAAVDALTEFLKWRKETQADFSLTVSINDKPIGETRFNGQNILGQWRKEVPIKGLAIDENNTVSFVKKDMNSLQNGLYYDLSLKYYLPQDQIPPRDEGFSIIRGIYRLDDKGNKTPLNEARVGDVVRVHLAITVPTDRRFVAVEDYIPAGFEIVNLDLATEEKSLRLAEKELVGRELMPAYKELRDDKAFLYVDQLNPGVYEYDYYIRALTPGKFNYLPTLVYEMYFPENFGRAAGSYFVVKQ
ncbi:MAG: alpha-2-macroglobulin family protein [bacterium]